MTTIKISGIDAVQKKLTGLPERVGRQVVREMSQIVYEAAEKGVRAHDKPRSQGGTGALFQSLYNRAIPGGREIGNDPRRAPHARFVHWGTRPHIIKPDKKHMLRWAGPGGWVFARMVRHPGYKGDAYLVKAADEAIRQFDAIVARTMKGV